MAFDAQGIVRDVLTSALPNGNGSSGHGSNGNRSNGGMSGVKGLAAGAGAAALAPLAFKTASKLARSAGVDSLTDAVKSPGETLRGAASNTEERLTEGVKDKAKGALDQAGGPSGIVKKAAKSMLPFGGGDSGGGKGGAPGAGKGRRMPVQQSVDIGLPLETVYNQWTQFEEWPSFMHRVKRVTQEDECTVSFAVKIWGKTKEFTAKIETQRPDRRIKWRVTEGMIHTGLVTFHELAPDLTRVQLGFDVDPGSLVEKFARGARHVKRAARGDLHRFKAFIEMAEQETGAWRGVIEDGELVEEHDPSYDEEREYSDIEELTSQQDSDEDAEDQDDDEDAEDQDSDDDEGGRSSRGGSRRQSSSQPQAASKPRARSRSSHSQSASRSSGSQSRARSRSRSSSNGQSSGSRGRARSQSRNS